LFLLAKAAWIQRRGNDAEALLRRTIEVWRAVLGSQHPTFASGLVCLAELLLEKHSSESGKLLREALDVFESQLGSHHPYTGSTLLLYSQYLKSHGEKREARKLRRRAEAIWAEYLRVNQLGRTLDVNAFEPTRQGTILSSGVFGYLAGGQTFSWMPVPPAFEPLILRGGTRVSACHSATRRLLPGC
jgi:hypothetical protein